MASVRAWIALRVDQVAGLPPTSSYTWGGRASPLAFSVFHLVAVLRLLSPLQWLKQVFRLRAGARRTTNLRLDFPAAFTEMYFLAELAAAAVLLFTDVRLPSWGEAAARVLACVLVLEATLWVLYYLLLRGLIEGRYTAYHPAEYLLQFPVVVAAQCALIALLLSVPVGEVFAALRGGDSGSLTGSPSAVLSLMGLVYLGAGVSSLINSLPVIAARGAEGFLIVGAGQVTQKRILPALSALGVRSREIQLLDTGPAAGSPGDMSPSAIVDRLVKMRTPVIIATPTASHLFYVEALAAEAMPFAVEKPIVAAEEELRRLRREPHLMARGFSLGYYALEKALPVTYLMTRREVYCSYLEASGGGQLPSGSELEDLVHRLGPVRSVHGWVLEDSSRSPSGDLRAWTEQPPSLGSLVETAVHPLHVAATIVPGLRSFIPSAIEVARHGPRAAAVLASTGQDIAPTFVDARGSAGDVSVRVTVGKHMAPSAAARGLVAHFDHGRLVADFDARCAVLEHEEGARVELHVQRKRAPYEVQMSLFRSMTHRGWIGGRYDQLDQQLDALEAWQAVRAFGRGAAVQTYDDERSPSGLAGLPVTEACGSAGEHQAESAVAGR